MVSDYRVRRCLGEIEMYKSIKLVVLNSRQIVCKWGVERRANDNCHRVAAKHQPPFERISIFSDFFHWLSDKAETVSWPAEHENNELTCALIDRLREFAGGAAAADCEWPDVRQTTRRHNAQWRIQSVQWPLMQLTTISSCRSVVGACTTELKLYTNRPFIHIERGDPGGHTRWKTIKVQNANSQMNFL